MAEHKATGRIFTFYSYKGGTGRTMALANVGWILASNGYRVLMVDWDLEAPGLHRYFHPFLTDKTLSTTKGVIDMVFDYQRTVLALPKANSPRELPAMWYEKQVDIFPYISELQWSHEGFGELHLLPAGQQTAEYGAKVNTFNWRQLYENLGGYEFFEAVKRQMCREYDYVLVDSRTGVSDTSGLCTVQMPDRLVVCFTLNTQSIEGASEVAVAVTEQRDPEDATEPFRVFPLPSRLEKAEKHKLELARDAARSHFDTFLTWLTPGDRERYWGGVEIFYEPYYAYEEVLATFADKPGMVNSLLASLERLTSYLTAGTVTEMRPMAESLRREVLTQYERQPLTTDDSVRRAAAVFGRFSARDADVARNILLRCVTPGVGSTVVRRAVATADFTPEDRPILNRLVDEGILSRKLAEDRETEFVTIADERLVETWATLRGWAQEQERQIRLHDLIEDLAERWEQAGRAPDMLLPRGAIPDALAAVDDPKQFTARAVNFVHESAREQTPSRQLKQAISALRWRLLAIALVILLIPLAALATYYVGPKLNDLLLLRRIDANTMQNPLDKLKYVLIPAGRFRMGCSYDDASNCRSEDVQITKSFWMGQTEVTNAAYQRYLSARQLDHDRPTSSDDFPVAQVDWLDATGYCGWAGGRLPTDAEWEYAARAGGRGRRYITGDSLVEAQISLGQRPSKVASHRPNGFGLYDMSGNVAEWTGDYETQFPYAPHPLRLVVASSEPLRNPRLGPLWGSLPSYLGVSTGLSVRGGSYLSTPWDLRLHYHEGRRVDTRDEAIGFRCVVEATDFEHVARTYSKTPFEGLYEAYLAEYQRTWYDYRGLWNAVYLRYLKDEQRASQPEPTQR